MEYFWLFNKSGTGMNIFQLHYICKYILFRQSKLEKRFNELITFNSILECVLVAVHRKIIEVWTVTNPHFSLLPTSESKAADPHTASCALYSSCPLLLILGWVKFKDYISLSVVLCTFVWRFNENLIWILPFQFQGEFYLMGICLFFFDDGHSGLLNQIDWKH